MHFTAEDIKDQIDYLYEHAEEDELPGYAIVLSSEQQEAFRNVLPTLTLAINSLPGGTVQRPHRHNFVAVSLVGLLFDGRRQTQGFVTVGNDDYACRLVPFASQ